MTIEAAAGSTFGVCLTAPTTYDASGYGALTMVPVGLIGSVPSFGRVFAKAEFKTLAGGTEKDKGGYDEGAITVPIADSTDAGQTALETLAGNRNIGHFCITTRKGTKYFNSGLVMGAPRTLGGQNDVITIEPNIEFTKEWIKVPAA